MLACTPRVGSHLLSDALTATGVAGRPREWLPRFTLDSAPKSSVDRMKLVSQIPADTTFDPVEDAALIRKILADGTTPNGVLGIVIHRIVFQDAARRFGVFTGTSEADPHRVFSAAFPGLDYIWMRRRDRAAQAVSWYKAIESGTYVGRERGEGEESKYDYAKIRHLHSALTSFENAWGSFFSASGVKPLVVWYEDLAKEYVATVRSVLDFLRIDSSAVEIARPKHEKYADTRSAAWIEQFKAQHAHARPAR